MEYILLTQSKTFIIGPIAKLLGWIMNGIFEVLNSLFGIQNIGLCIIIFTIIIYMLMLPLTIKQQKYAKLSSKMTPEINAIQKKYRNKKDQASIMKMNEETNAVYAKYGTSPTGSCVQLLIQLPVMYALYRVVYNIPAYVANVKDCFTGLVDQIVATSDYQNIITQFKDSISNLSVVKLDFSTIDTTKNSIIDVLYRLQTSGWESLRDTFPSLADTITNAEQELEHMNYFLGINIANSPSYILKQGIATGETVLILVAIAIPLLSVITQLASTKLMQQMQDMSQMQDNPMASSMKTMTYTMPFISAVFCFTLPYGVGIYWITGPVIRMIQTFFINRYLNKMDMDKFIEKNKKKAEKKAEKKADSPFMKAAGLSNTENIRTMSEKAKVSTKNIQKKEFDYAVDDKTSLASRANLVKQYNEKNNSQ